MLIDDIAISQEELKEILHYDPETGIFTRRVASANNKMKVGQVAGNIDRGYVRIMVMGRLYRAHRLAWLYVHGRFPPDEIDHINGVRGDNRLCNLRPATKSQNGMNRGAIRGKTSGYKGVSWHKRDKKWHAQATVDGNHHCLGYFDTAEEASVAYQSFVMPIHGEFYNGGVAVC